MLHFISVRQALDIWSDLEAAYYGKNSYGGDTTEIYIHQLLCGPPRDMTHLNHPGTVGDMTRDTYDQANHALHDLLVLFTQQHTVKIEVEGRELGEWLKTARYAHRVHVKVGHL